MAECFLVKRIGPTLTPADQEAKDVLDKLKVGATLKCKITTVRNMKFHNKWFALARFAFDYFEPVVNEKDAKWQPQKNFDSFRKELIVRAGYYVASYKIDGSIRIDAKSIALENMQEDEFDKLYDATLTVVIDQICTHLPKEEIDVAVEAALNFAG